jgi:hypothetical protein
MYDRQELIYSAPLMHQDYIVYPGHNHDLFELSASVSSHYHYYPKLVLHRLSEEQFACAFANNLPHWQLTHLSLQTLSPATIAKIISVVNLTLIKQLILVDLEPSCLQDIYDKLFSFTFGRPQVIKVICPNNPEWQANFNSLFEPVTKRYLEYIANKNTNLATQVEDQQNQIQGLTQQKEQYEAQLLAYEKQIEKLKTKLLRNKESADNRIQAAENEHKKVLAKLDNAASTSDKNSKALIQALAAVEEQKRELQEIHSMNNTLKQTLHRQRELRVIDRDKHEEELRNLPILPPASIPLLSFLLNYVK